MSRQPAITLRRATPADAGAIARLLAISSNGLLAAEYAAQARPGESWQEAARRAIADPNSALSYVDCIIAMVGGQAGPQMGGFMALALCEEPMLREAMVSYAREPRALGVLNLLLRALDMLIIRELAVVPSARRKGVASTLIGLAEEQARASGAKGVALTVEEGNAAARALYTRLGFVTAGQEEGETRLILMVKLHA